MALSKRDLGIGYLSGSGLALALSLLGYVWATRESVLVIAISTTMALGLFATIIYIGFLFLEVDLSEQFVWNVARWSALGLGIAVILSIVVAGSRRYLAASAFLPSLLVITIATGGVIGTLLGVVVGLREQHRRMRMITQRNTVMNRVLRHNIRNTMNVVSGHLSLLADEADLRGHQSVRAIDRAVANVISLSESARDVDTLEATTAESEPVDVVRLIEEYLETAREQYPEASFSVDVPESAWVSANPIVASAVTHLIENAIEHNDREPEISLSIRIEDTDERMTIVVADNGPGIPDEEIAVLFKEDEDPTNHGSGLGLWFVKWVVDTYGGELRFEANDPRGTVVHLSLPAADRPTTRDTPGDDARRSNTVATDG